MTIEDEHVVDIVSINADRTAVVLTISDHLDWSDSLAHQSLLENKLNSYLAFVDSGELIERYPTARGLPVEFEIVFVVRPDRGSEAFLGEVKRKMSNFGFRLRTRVFAESTTIDTQPALPSDRYVRCIAKHS